MTILRLALLPLLAALAAGGVQPVRADSGDPPTPRHETVEEHWPDGKLRERKQVLRLEDGTTVDDGPFERWYNDGTKEYEAVFVRGKKEGTTVRYHRNGKVASRQQYRDGVRNGPSVSWNDKGEKVKEENWADGRPDGTWTVWEDGKVAWTHRFVHGDPDP
jgi:antitoxin component YwqK of YwqJK toxin-antitoxin module